MYLLRTLRNFSNLGSFKSKHRSSDSKRFPEFDSRSLITSNWRVVQIVDPDLSQHSVTVSAKNSHSFTVPKGTIKRLERTGGIRVVDFMARAIEPLIDKAQLDIDLDAFRLACSKSADQRNYMESVNNAISLNVEPPKLNLELLSIAKELVVREVWPNKEFKLKSETNVAKLLSLTNLSANFGLPHLDSKRKHIGDLIKVYSSFSDGYDLQQVDGLCRFPSVVFFRITVKNTYELAFRCVFGVSGYQVACEMRFSVVLTAYFSLITGKCPVLVGMSQLFLSERMLSLERYYRYSIDFSKFDGRLHPIILIMALQILFMPFINEDSRCKAYVEGLIRALVWCPFWYPLVGVVFRKRGLTSGSSFTNMAGSVSNLLILRYALTVLGKNEIVHSMLVH